MKTVKMTTMVDDRKLNSFGFFLFVGNGTFTFQGDDSCLPVTFADQSEGSATAGR